MSECYSKITNKKQEKQILWNISRKSFAALDFLLRYLLFPNNNQPTTTTESSTNMMKKFYSSFMCLNDNNAGIYIVCHIIHAFLLCIGVLIIQLVVSLYGLYIYISGKISISIFYIYIYIDRVYL